jgi:hypothetical protein
MNASAAAPNPTPLQQLSGRLEDVFGEQGIQSRLRFTINLNNQNTCGLELINVTARLHAQFLEEGHGAGQTLGPFVMDATLDRMFTPATVSQGDSGSWIVYAAFPFDIFAEFENQRKDRDVLLQLNVMYTVIERTPQGLLGERHLTAEMVHVRSGGNQYIPLLIPKSKWQTVLANMGYSNELRASRQTLLSAVQKAVKASDEAEAAAKAAKEASSLTGVITLAEAYSQEATRLAKTSRRWLYVAAGSAIACVLATLSYVYESFAHSQLTPAQVIARLTVIAILFATAGLCMRTYNAYQHLELLNRHRVNIGKTFEVFKAAQPNDHAREVLAALTAQEMIDFGRGNFPGKDAPDTQLSLVTELLKTAIERPK